jgi:hypothetical protein
VHDGLLRKKVRLACLVFNSVYPRTPPDFGRYRLVHLRLYSAELKLIPPRVAHSFTESAGHHEWVIEQIYLMTTIDQKSLPQTFLCGSAKPNGAFIF